ncbi:MAG: nucleotidyltransferase [Deltaproteobacteria bacterium]|nr:nucleotidyltransferase [Deltaproteobacteria bacterium]
MGAPDPGTIAEALGRLARMLAEWASPAAVIGGIAIVARVRPRLTTDIDLVIAVTPDRIGELLSLARRHGWEHDPEETAELAAGGLARLWGPPSPSEGVGLDLLFVDSPFLVSVVSRATPVSLGGAELPVATVEDLLVMKLEAHRPEDLDDILAIKDAFAERLDLAYVRRNTDQLGISERLDLYFGSAAG